MEPMEGLGRELGGQGLGKESPPQHGLPFQNQIQAFLIYLFGSYGRGFSFRYSGFWGCLFLLPLLSLICMIPF